jgi:hypothetical protein
MLVGLMIANPLDRFAVAFGGHRVLKSVRVGLKILGQQRVIVGWVASRSQNHA